MNPRSTHGLASNLKSRSLILRPWKESGAEALYKYASDPDVGHAAGCLPHKSVADSLRVIRESLMMPEVYAITLREDGEGARPVGVIGLRIGEASDLAIGSDQAQLSYWIAKPLWGKGIVPEAVRSVMRHAFNDLGLEAIWAGNSTDNDRSRRVQEKTGFSHQRTIRDRLRREVGDYVNEDITWITRDDWEVLQRADPTDDETIRVQQGEAATIISTMPRIAFVRSGETGADRAAFDAAREAGVPICGWCPKNGLAEDLPDHPGLPVRYPELTESPSEGYVERTAWNVRDSHATLIITPAGVEPKSGTDLTVRFAEAYGRPCLIVRGRDERGTIRPWLESLGYGITLNVAGPRESKTPGTYALTREIMAALLA